LSDTVLVAVLATIPPTLLGAAALVVALKTTKKVEQVHKATNSLTDRLVASTRVEAHAAGVKEEKERRDTEEMY
jgi:hypothetical protein